MSKAGKAEVRDMILRTMRDTSLSGLIDELEPVLTGGQMLRGELVLAASPAGGVDSSTAVACAAAVEMIHAASLIHDDVIDGGELRRGVSSFWMQKGTAGAILVGDLLVCRSISLLSDLPAADVLVPALAQFAGEMCEAEVEQELVLRGTAPSWDQCVSTARRKTGSLFAFAGYASGSAQDTRLALKEAGYQLGTAYQLSDDFYDVYGDRALADKSLGHDADRDKVTAASSWAADAREPLAYIDGLCEASSSMLEAWPELQAVWSSYVKEYVSPAMDRFLIGARNELNAAERCVGS
jgi:geranylgeranyl pyrophosphate synthase